MQDLEVKKIYLDKKDEIETRLKEFSQVWGKKSDREIFAELVYCLLTPQSKAKICWSAVLNLLRKNVLWAGNENKVFSELKGVRFKKRKAKYICEARRLFSDNGEIVVRSKLEQFLNVYKTRDWLVQNVKGVGYKVASHFLRNIGLGTGLAILDRHILKNLKLLRVIDNVPNSLSKKKYFEIEEKMTKFAHKLSVPMGCLDLVLWSKETGEVFK